jgi:hypothetical protein
MWKAILALLSAITWIGRIVDRFPTRQQRRLDAFQKAKQREREAIDRWIRGDGPPPSAS